jgi:O-methyltransferase
MHLTLRRTRWARSSSSKTLDATTLRGKKLRGLRLIGRIGRYLSLYRRFRDRTLLGRDAYLANLYLADVYLSDPRLRSGCIVECGCWRGGMAAGLTSIGGPARHYFFFDSFEGLPPASAEDGAFAKQWQATRDGTKHRDNCTASLEEFTQTMRSLPIPSERVHVHEGFFEDTFPHVEVPSIAVLRLDADWYDSTMQCLDTFWERLLPGALVIVDDYYDWEGCRRALHAFLAKRQETAAIRQSRFGKVAYLVKPIA